MNEILSNLIFFVLIFGVAALLRTLHVISMRRPATWIFLGRRLLDWPGCTVVAVRKGFDWFAFALPPIWSFMYGSGLIGFGYILVLTAGIISVSEHHVPVPIACTIGFVAHYCFGWIANGVKTWSLITSGYIVVSAEYAGNNETAERIRKQIQDDWRDTEFPKNLEQWIRQAERLQH